MTTHIWPEVCRLRPETANWLADADYDFETARDLFAAGRHAYAVFFLHLAVEKTLKAILTEATGSDPPRIHDLVRLARLAGLSLAPEQEEFLSDLTEAQAETRYRKQSAPTLSRYPAQLAQWYIERCAEVTTWLKIDPRLQP